MAQLLSSVINGSIAINGNINLNGEKISSVIRSITSTTTLGGGELAGYNSSGILYSKTGTINRSMEVVNKAYLAENKRPKIFQCKSCTTATDGNYFNVSYSDSDFFSICQLILIQFTLPETTTYSGNCYIRFNSNDGNSHTDKQIVTIDGNTILANSKTMSQLYSYQNLFIKNNSAILFYWIPTSSFLIPLTKLNEETFYDKYPVGAIYISTYNTSPAKLFGGTWEPIVGHFLIGAGDIVSKNLTTNKNVTFGTTRYNSNVTFEAGEYGGESLHTLKETEMPSHTHADRIGWLDDQKTNNVLGVGGSPLTVVGGGVKNNARVDDPNAHVGLTGGSVSHNNMPPYLAVYMWKRTE